MWKRANETRRQQAHVSSEADEIDVCLLQCGDYFRVVLLANFTFRWDYNGVQPELARMFDARCFRTIGDDDRNACGDQSFIDVFGDGGEVRTTSGKKNAKVLHKKEYCSTESTRSHGEMRGREPALSESRRGARGTSLAVENLALALND